MCGFIVTNIRCEIENLPNLECTEYQDEDLGVIHSIMTVKVHHVLSTCMSLNSTVPLGSVLS